jgi:hypothetical protein
MRRRRGCSCGYGDYREDYILLPVAYFEFARRMIPQEEFYARLPEIRDISVELADELRDFWPETEGFGSSDRTHELRKILGRLGYESDWTGPGRTLRVTGRRK